MKHFLQAVLAFAMAIAATAADPTITINKVAQRYPWNGLVDFEFTITGDSGVKYETSFSAMDNVSGEMLWMSTIFKSDGSNAAVTEKLLPGNYKWIWDAGRDLKKDKIVRDGFLTTTSAVLFQGVDLSEVSDFAANPAGTSIGHGLVRGYNVKTDGRGKSIQFQSQTTDWLKCITVYLEQSGGDIVGYIKSARYMPSSYPLGTDFDNTSNKTISIATSNTATGYGIGSITLYVPVLKTVLNLDRMRIVGDSRKTSSPIVSVTGNSAEFHFDLRGMGPWESHVAAANETISYSPAWATNGGANAQSVVKVAKARKTKPKYIAIDLSGGTTAKHYPIEYLDEIPGGTWSDTYKTSKLVLRHIPAGSFIMGGRNTDYPGAVNTNLHMVTITKDFYMGVFEVTQRQWELVMGNRPSHFTNVTCYAMRPVEYVSHYDVRGSEKGSRWPASKDVDGYSFMGKLRMRTGVDGFDLPTEAQWEYACRAGTTTALNVGVDFDSSGARAANVGMVARIYYTSHGDYEGDERNCPLSYGTITVGTLMPNGFGLYDMHGNVWERVLDKWDAQLYGAVDPCGPSDRSEMLARGGGWSTTKPGRIGSASRDVNAAVRETMVGFRLCLQGGEIPEVADEATEFVVASASGTKTWTPTEAGTYILTHEVTNATGVVELDSARFAVGGPTLELEPQGELEKGVGVAVNGAWDGWQVYYTLDGSAPTTNSAAYVDAITMDDSGTLRAIAYNPTTGVYSSPVSATLQLHDALGLVGAVAKPRYPWNGKVDVDFELQGDPEQRYLVELVAMDMEGNTNLPVRTVYMGGPRSVAAGDGAGEADAQERVPPTLGPGKYRAVWDADADIAHDFDFGRVAVTVKVTSSHLLPYAKRLDLTVAGYTGTEVLTNVPTLVRLSVAVNGFDYNDFTSPTNGADLAFFTQEGKSLPYEIDEWHTNGESLVWVKLPELKRGTKFTAAWGGSAARGLAALPSQLQTSNLKHQTWSDYAGVWHMNEDSGTAFDSTEHRLDGIPSCGTNELAGVDQMVAYKDGACGRARVNGCREAVAGNYLYVPSYDALSLGGVFTVAGWFRISSVIPSAGRNCPRLISRKRYWKDLDGWEFNLNKGIQSSSESESFVVVRGASEVALIDVSLGPFDEWISVGVVYADDRAQLYTNGIFAAEMEIAGTMDNGLNLAIGCDADGSERSLHGQYDEIRLIGGTLSADRIKADYDMIANRRFLHYDRVTTPEQAERARFAPVWTFESIPVPDPNDEWAPETVYNDIQTVVAMGEVENPQPAIRCLNDAWGLDGKLGRNAVFSGASLALRFDRRYSGEPAHKNRFMLWAHDDSTNVYRIATLDYESGDVDTVVDTSVVDAPDVRAVTMKNDLRGYLVVSRPNAPDLFIKTSEYDYYSWTFTNRHDNVEHGSALCGYIPGGVPMINGAERQTWDVALDGIVTTNYMSVFFSGTVGEDSRQSVVRVRVNTSNVGGHQVDFCATSTDSCMKNPTGRYVVPMLDANTYFTVGHGLSDANLTQHQRVFTGRFDLVNEETDDMRPVDGNFVVDWGRSGSVAYSKGVAMPDGRNIFLGGAGRDADGRVRMAYDGVSYTNCTFYPVGHPFESWNRRDITCLLPNGKFCGVDEKLGLVVVNPLNGDWYVASDRPEFKVGKMGCQLLPNGKVLIIPYNADDDLTGGLAVCGKLYEVDFGFTKSFSVTTLTSPYVRVAEGEPEPSGVKVGLNANGGKLAEFAKYYPQANPVYGELPAPTWSGHVFKGWGVSADAVECVRATDPVPATGGVLYAIWQ